MCKPGVEWARLEVAALMGHEYLLPQVQQKFAGSVICLARQEQPAPFAWGAELPGVHFRPMAPRAAAKPPREKP